jgi:hypothetical protein
MACPYPAADFTAGSPFGAVRSHCSLRLATGLAGLAAGWRRRSLHENRHQRTHRNALSHSRSGRLERLNSLSSRLRTDLIWCR